MSNDNKSPEQQIEELEAKIKSLNEVADKAGEPVYTAVKKSIDSDTGAAAVTSWEGDDEVISFDVNPETGRAIAKSYDSTSKIKGYGGAHKESNFKSAGEFYKYGMKASASELKSRHEASFKSIQGLNTQVGGEGGYMIYPEFAPGILEHLYSNDIFSRTDNYTCNGNSLTFTRTSSTSRKNGSRHSGVQGGWVEEGGLISKTHPTLKRVDLRLKKLGCVVYLTNELLEDGGSVLEQYVNKMVADEFAFMIGDSIFNGVGAGQPLGIMKSGALISVAKEVGQAADSIVASNVDNMWARRFAGNRSYSWYHNQDACPQLDNLAQDVGTGGVALYRPENGIAGVAPQMLKSAPRVETEFQETVGDFGDLVLADLSQVVSISKSGLTQDASVHVEFLTDQLALKFTMRLDARPWEDTPIEQYKTANTQSAFVALAERA